MKAELLEGEVMRLLSLVRPLIDGALRLRPVHAADVTAFERKHRLELPDELKGWLRHCDGAPVSPGGIYPLFSRSPDQASIDWYLESFPSWRDRGWIPIASDGCGDVFLLATRIRAPGGTHPVFFLDQADFENPAYLVASGLWRFLYFLLKSELERDQGQHVSWPFDRDAVLTEDPDLAACSGMPFPWDTVGGP